MGDTPINRPGKGASCLAASPPGLCRGESSCGCPSPGLSMAVALQTRDTCGYQPAPTIIHIHGSSPFLFSPHGHLEIKDLMQRWGKQLRNINLLCICGVFDTKSVPRCSKPTAASASPSQAAAFIAPGTRQLPVNYWIFIPRPPPCTPQPHPR